MPYARLATAILALIAGLIAPCLGETSISDKFVQSALALQNPRVRYDAAYHRIAYPRGDVAAETGVCADVIVRAYRGIGIDLQTLVHEDMVQHFSAYPSTWRMTHPDANIDHRRVPNLMTFFRRHGTIRATTNRAEDYAPGDIVTWNLRPGGMLPHIGIVTNRRSADGLRPLMMHNIGGGQVLEEVLFAYPITGHFRYALT